MDKEFKEKAKAFKAEFKALLKKYDAEIDRSELRTQRETYLLNYEKRA